MVVGSSLMIHGATYFDDWQDLTRILIGILACAAGVALLAGFMTPVVSVIVILGGLAEVLSLLPLPQFSQVSSLLTILEIVALAAALAFLGPGAFSFDARIFGRREIRIPPLHESSH